MQFKLIIVTLKSWLRLSFGTVCLKNVPVHWVELWCTHLQRRAGGAWKADGLIPIGFCTPSPFHSRFLNGLLQYTHYHPHNSLHPAIYPQTNSCFRKKHMMGILAKPCMKLIVVA